MPLLTTQDAPSNTSSYYAEISRGERFAFGRNWQAFLRMVDDTRIRQAEESLATMLRLPTLVGKSFLDIGSGSGLFSLAARRLGARVHSFDFDAESVSCAAELRRRYFPGDLEWTVEQGSVLDATYMHRLGTFDIVYSWGVLHHTGRMWEAVDAACERVAVGGKLFIALYNDLGTRTVRWRHIKKVYNRLPAFARPAFTLAAMLPQEFKDFARAAAAGRPGRYFALWHQYNGRGMNRWRDMVDWVGGYPYEVATPEAVFEFCRQRGFTLTNLRCGGVGLGCNEFVFDRVQRQAL
jgi:2-polyprenyl-6-hydroxyphenyl methylase/3-demethylubiquinone-9 3-methyltransferase